jgi:hypothetical protein
MTREEAINNLESLYNEVYNEDSDGYIYAEAIDMAIEALSADVVSREKYNKVNDLYLMSIKTMMNKPVIVRCKDCRFNKYPSNDLCLIKKAGIYPDDNDFCSYGERKKK